MLKVELLGFESLGVRSMATVIYTDNTVLVIDPGASLAPIRYSLPPHEIEWARLHEVMDKISNALRDADAFIVTHYHYDHHDPGKYLDLSLYRGKQALLKDPRNNINISQRIRAGKFLRLIRDKVKGLTIIDGATLRINDLTLKFSKPVPHGPNDRLGYVIMVSVIHEDLTLTFTSDIEGPLNDYEESFIRESSPNILIVDGPPTYLTDDKYPEYYVKLSIKYMANILRSVRSLNYVIIDHHLLRDLNYREYYKEVLKLHGSSKAKVMCAAEFMGREPELLEARRRELYSGSL